MEKVKFELEFIVNSSPKIIYNCLSTPSGLSEWFADDVNIKGDIFTFMWEGSEEKAKLLTKKRDEFVKFQWLDQLEEGLKTYFELRIKIDAMTNERAIIVTGFADEDEVEEAKALWETQINELKHILGG